MISASDTYRHQHKDIVYNNRLVALTAACTTFINVTATIGCPNNENECITRMADHCDLPFHAAGADLAMSVFFMAAIYLARSAEKKVQVELDEAVQTAQDYSVMVMDPDGDADDPDEW